MRPQWVHFLLLAHFFGPVYGRSNINSASCFSFLWTVSLAGVVNLQSHSSQEIGQPSGHCFWWRSRLHRLLACCPSKSTSMGVDVDGPSCTVGATTAVRSRANGTFSPFLLLFPLVALSSLVYCTFVSPKVSCIAPGSSAKSISTI
jgi:hypothetical protein